MENKLIKVTGLWKSQDKKGNPVLTGNLGGARLVILVNIYKEKDNQPDFNLFFTENKPKDKQQDNHQASKVML